MSESRRSWQKWGEVDPYFGVVSHDKYRKSVLDDRARQDFFRSGEDHVARVMALVEGGPAKVETHSVLDFGCGVGRLLLPFAKRFDRAVGVDVSEGMLRELGRVMAAEGIGNYETLPALEALPAEAAFDLVHSYIVLQHIEVGQGMRLIDRLSRLVRKHSGVIAIHVTYASTASWMKRAVSYLRPKFPPLHWLLNVLKGRHVAAPYMQMNSYPVAAIFEMLQQRGFREFRCYGTDHGGVLGLMIVGFQAGGEG